MQRQPTTQRSKAGGWLAHVVVNVEPFAVTGAWANLQLPGLIAHDLRAEGNVVTAWAALRVEADDAVGARRRAVELLRRALGRHQAMAEGATIEVVARREVGDDKHFVRRDEHNRREGLSPLRLAQVTRGPSPKVLVARWFNSGRPIGLVRTDEDADRVMITVLERTPPVMSRGETGELMVRRSGTRTIDLERPLDGRRIIDGYDGTAR